MIFDYISKSKIINQEYKRINNTTFDFNIYKIASDYKKNNRMIFVVLPRLFEAQEYYDTLINLLDEKDVLFYPVDDFSLANNYVSSKEFKYERINTLINLLNNETKIIVTNVSGLLRNNLSKKIWKDNILSFEINKEYDLKEIKTKLIEQGFVSKSIVSKTGEFSARGSIIDLFPLNFDSPIRLDFFDNELESIKIFDVETQRTYKKITKIDVFPLEEIFYSEDKKKNIIQALSLKKGLASSSEYQTLIETIRRIDLRTETELLYSFISLFDETSSIIDFIDDKKIYLINEDKALSVIKTNEEQIKKYYDDINSIVVKDFDKCLNLDDVINNQNITYIDTLVDHQSSIKIDIEKIDSFKGNFNLIAKEIKNHWGTNYVIVSINSKDKLKRFKEFLLEEGILYQTVKNENELQKEYVNLASNEYSLSLSIPKEQVYILSENVLFSNDGINRKIRYKSTFTESTKINKYDELNPGDFVVHINYGIGRYDGIKTMELSNKKRDYLMISYQGTDKLYIPIEQLNLIKKYSSQESHIPTLTKLGSSSWSKTKQKVKEKVLELSKQLIELYAKREASSGFEFLPDSEEQIEFENDFTFEETKDQVLAIEAVKRDMESKRPMDRLICGDVGFGKTEIALRASFKAVMSGKQVCYLAPTTILSRQHYHTFKNRMEKFGVRVELLNRFISAKERKQILKDLAFGTVDVIIGTHRLLSDDVKFKDLGLLITDEEQRFGVMHKEQIKRMKVNVDSLMLTATPIPRTLQMSLIGIKELSMIETPPKNRYPIQTYVTPRHDVIIKEAIERELLRGGQVFYLYNYTDDIEDMMIKISKLVPEAKVCFAHGKMNKNVLEEVITDFLNHKYDVLVSTTIIETGIDIPEANTLIIHDADHLGLSQLYQIRGRVGRSDRIAYAYLMYKSGKVLTADAEKRLAAIKEFAELGSGFKIAMKDLAIRGAGDVLGHEQSGFINSVGIDLYMQILEETVKELTHDTIECEHNVQMGKTQLSNRYIPEKYELDEDVKISIHQKINKIESFDDFNDLKLEFEDRFGRLEDSLLIYMYEKLFYSLCSKNKIENVDIKPKIVTLTMSLERSQNVNGEFIYKTAYEMSNDFLLSYHNQRIVISLKTNLYENNSWLKLMCDYLAKIV